MNSRITYQRAYKNRNRSSVNANTRRWYADRVAANPDEARGRERARHLRQKYKLSVVAWLAMFVCQGLRCAICRSSDPKCARGWATDHDHHTGRVRAILCHACNKLLGCAEDRPEILAAAGAYLRGHK